MPESGTNIEHVQCTSANANFTHVPWCQQTRPYGKVRGPRNP